MSSQSSPSFDSFLVHLRNASRTELDSMGLLRPLRLIVEATPDTVNYSLCKSSYFDFRSNGDFVYRPVPLVVRTDRGLSPSALRRGACEPRFTRLYLSRECATTHVNKLTERDQRALQDPFTVRNALLDIVAFVQQNGWRMSVPIDDSVYAQFGRVEYIPTQRKKEK